MELLKFTMTFSTHGVLVTKFDTGEVRCWKYTNSRCDYESFCSEEAAIEYIITPFPSLGWQVEITEC